MDKFIILPDFTCDLPKDVRNEIGLTEYVKGYVNFSDGRDIIAGLDFEPMPKSEFYKVLNNKKLKVTTAPLNPEGYYAAFEKYVSEGYKIISISLSSKISATHSIASSAAEKVKVKYPESEIYCFDSFRMSGGIGLLAFYAQTMKNQGKSFDEVVAWLENNKRRVHLMGPIDDLLFVAKRGEITKGKAIMGNFAGVKPMGECSPEGYVTVLTKIKGIKKALDATVSYVKEMARDVENNYLFIAHSDREQYAEDLKTMLKEQLSPKGIIVSDVYYGCGANIGPGMVSVYFLGDEISENLEKEKAVMQSIFEK